MKSNIFKKIMVTGLASAVCVGGASSMNLSSTNNLTIPSAYAATITDTDLSATGVIKSNVSMRKGPGTSYTRLATLSKNTKITIVAKSSNGWYKINNNDGYAYVYSQYVTLDSSSTTPSTPSTPSTDPDNNDTAYSATGTTKYTLNVRKGPSTSTTSIGKLAKNAKVTIVAKASNGWYKIQYNNGYGYVSNDYITIGSTPSTDPGSNDTAYSATGTTKYTLNVRKGPSTSTTSIGKLAKNAKVTIVAKASNGWYKIKFGNSYGYVSNDYITIGSTPSTGTGSKTGVVNHAVYVRKGASTKYAKLGTLAKNKKVTIVSKTSDGWYKIKYGNGYGYVYGSYVNA